MGTVPSSPLLYTHQREEKKKRTTKEKENTHTQSHSRYLVQLKPGCLEAEVTPPTLQLKGRLGAPHEGQTLGSSSGFESCHQGHSRPSPWALRDAIPGPRSHSAEVTFSTRWARAAVDQGHVQGRHFLCTRDALGLPFIPGIEVPGHRVARPASPSLLMNEGEPRFEQFEALTDKPRVVGTVTGNWKLWSPGFREATEASWDGAERQAPPHHGGCNCMSPSAIASSGDEASPAPKNCLESLDGSGVIRQGEAWVGPRARVRSPV